MHAANILKSLAAALMLSCEGAQALEVTVDNQTATSAAFAFSYLDKESKAWTVTGWFNVGPKAQGVIDLPSDNPLYYLYAEFSNGKKIEGGEGAVTLKVQNRSFSWPQDQMPGKRVREVSFVRARGTGGKATVRVK